MKSYLVEIWHGQPSLKFNGYIHEDKEDDWDEPRIYLDKLPRGFENDDMVYFNKRGKLHLIDSRPIEEYDKILKELMYDEKGRLKKPTPEEYAKIKVYQTLLWEYQEKPKLLSGKEEKEFIKWKKEKQERELEEYFKENS